MSAAWGAGRELALAVVDHKAQGNSRSDRDQATLRACCAVRLPETRPGLRSYALPVTLPPPGGVEAPGELRPVIGQEDPGRLADEPGRQAFVRLVFERIAVDGGQIPAVEPRPDLLPLFADRPGVYSGSDGTRTRERHLIEIRVGGLR